MSAATLERQRRTGRRVRTVPLVLESVRRSMRGADTTRRLKGYAAVFNTPSEWLGFREVLEPGCFRQALKRADCDPRLYFGHDSNAPLARVSAGNLRVWEDATGLAFEASLPDTQLASDLLELLRAGVLREMSFAFVPDPARERWQGDTVFVEQVARLLEVSIVSEPAYTATSVQEARGQRATLQAIRERLTARERAVYGAGSEQSWFRDLAMVSLALRSQQEAAKHWRPAPRLEVFAPKIAARGAGDITTMLSRLQSVPQSRDVGTGALAGLADVPTGGVPEFIRLSFATAARAKTALAGRLVQAELPAGYTVPAGYVQSAGEVTTGSTAAVQATENTAVSETDPDATAVALKPATIAGTFTVSRQLLERGTGADELLAADLGAALGAALEDQVLNGTGSSGQMTGLRNVAGAVAVAYTDTTPSQAELWPALLQARSQVARLAAETPTLLGLHPRRLSWLLAALDTAGGWAQLTPPLEPVETLGIPTTLGAGSDEDAILVLAPELITLFTRTPRIELWNMSPQGLTFTCWQLGALVARRAKAVGVITGTGLVAPAGY
jgi:HK97 family phage prohead protease